MPFPDRRIRVAMTAGAAAILASVPSPRSNAQLAAAESADAASRSFDDAQFRKDYRALSERLSPTMVYISGSGRLGGRSEFLAAFSDAATHFDPFVITDRRLVTLDPDVVTVTADGRISGTDANGRFNEHFRYSDTFARRGRSWQVVFVQVTRLP